MADVGAVTGVDRSGVAFLVAAGLVYEVIAAQCSSPQTTEINAAVRADTLMKWVSIGVINAAVLVGIAAAIDPKHRTEVLAGGALGAGIMIVSYAHAKRAGLSHPGKPTET